jgi:signal peptidase I
VTATTEAPLDEPAPEEEQESTRPSLMHEAVEWVMVLGGALVIAFLIQRFLFQPFFIPSGSMEPTLAIDDRVLVNKLSYRLHEVNRGDIVVFERSAGEPGAIRDLIKRVVAVGGDTIESRGDVLYVNDQPVKEPYRKSASLGGPVTRMTIAPDQVFVMGDNRTSSGDSRVFGPIPEDRIVGRAFVKFWPLGDLGLL